MTMARSQNSQKDKSPKKAISSSQAKMDGKKDGKKKRPKYNDLNFKPYIHKVLKQVSQEVEFTISRAAMITMNDFMIDIMQRLGSQASSLARLDQMHRARDRLTGNAIVKIDSRHIQTSVRFLLPGELGRHAISEGTKAVETYYRNTNKN